MVVIAIVSLLTALALPSYQGYVDQARQATLRSAAQSMAVRQALYRAKEGTLLQRRLVSGGWPYGDRLGALQGADAFTYAVSAGGDGYAVTVTDPAASEEVVVIYASPPAGQP